MKKVTVYFFEKYDITTDRNVRSKRPATLDTINSVHGQAIVETALEIDETELDGDGVRKSDGQIRRCVCQPCVTLPTVPIQNTFRLRPSPSLPSYGEKSP